MSFNSGEFHSSNFAYCLGEATKSYAAENSWEVLATRTLLYDKSLVPDIDINLLDKDLKATDVRIAKKNILLNAIGSALVSPLCEINTYNAVCNSGIMIRHIRSNSYFNVNNLEIMQHTAEVITHHKIGKLFLDGFYKNRIDYTIQLLGVGDTRAKQTANMFQKIIERRK